MKALLRFLLATQFPGPVGGGIERLLGRFVKGIRRHFSGKVVAGHVYMTPSRVRQAKALRKP